tara:strand:+ start:183 stop:965 length:783 start_codon:yes stop_codon:yes gene_type:complete
MSQRDKERRRRGQVSRVTPYTGFPINTQQFVQPQRSAGIPMGGSSVTTGPAQFQESQSASTPLGGLLAAKESYDQVNKAYEGGENIRKAYDKGVDSLSSGNYAPGGLMDQGQDALTGLSNMFGSSSTMTNAMGRDMVASPEMMNLLGGDTASRAGLLGGDVGSMSGMDTIMDPTFNFGGSATTGIDGAATADGLSGLQTTPGGDGGGMGANFAYAKIGLDVIDGGPEGQKITGNSFGDAALRGGAAYFTGGLSEIFYAFL